jgi:S-DNA-T family DNA segregation ATPase FtsK/SpoIIIE
VNPYDPYDPFSTEPDPYGGFSLQHLEHLALVGAVWLLVFVGVVIAALVIWRHNDPATYERCFAAPVRRARWWFWAYGSWSRLAKRCGLSFSEQVTRKDKEGRQTTTTVWNHPRLLRVKTSDHCLHLTVRTRMGQTVQDLEKAVPAIGAAARAHSARSIVVAPGTVRMEFVMREQLAGIHHAQMPTQLTTTTVRLGRCGRAQRRGVRVALDRVTLPVAV